MTQETPNTVQVTNSNGTAAGAGEEVHASLSRERLSSARDTDRMLNVGDEHSAKEIPVTDDGGSSAEEPSTAKGGA